MAFAIHDRKTSGLLQGCFVNSKTKERIGDFFFLPYTDAQADRPGSYTFDNYNRFDYVWSADSTHVAIVNIHRRIGFIHPFRRSSNAYEPLQMPDLVAALETHLKGSLQESNTTFIRANRRLPNHRLIATISKEAQVSNTGDENRDWKKHSLKFTISFDRKGQPTIESKRILVEKPSP